MTIFPSLSKSKPFDTVATTESLVRYGTTLSKIFPKASEVIAMITYLLSSIACSNSSTLKSLASFKSGYLCLGWSFPFLSSSIMCPSSSVPHSLTSCPFSIKGVVRALPIAPAPIIVIFSISITFVIYSFHRFQSSFRLLAKSSLRQKLIPAMHSIPSLHFLHR